jgi:anti-anti-sigma factor
MQITVAEHDTEVAVLKLEGRLDLLSAASVKSKIAEAVERGRRKIVIDLSAVSMVDSSGLGALIGGLKTTRVAGGDLRLSGAQEQAKLILRLTMLDKVLVDYQKFEDAVASYR